MPGFPLIQVTLIQLFSYELNILNYHELWEDKKFSDEIRHFDWIKLIDCYQLVDTD